MRRVLMTALASGAIGLATPAIAVPTLQQQNGPDLTTAIHASTTSGIDTGVVVYACTQNNGQCANTTFTGLDSSSAGTSIHITDGAGFASITDSNYNSQVPSTADLFYLIMDPTPDFTDYEFSVQLVNAGGVSIYYMLAGGSGWTLANSTPSPIQQNANANTQYILHGNGSAFGAVMIHSTGAIFEVKQNSINLVSAAVPEPGTWGLMLLGFAGIGMAMRRSRRRSATLMQVA
ncbi:MAG: PEPxxWA-CTERM sorting domain-containing protein [Sphingomicrobium sp.]